jgi:hypothetical protein
MRSVTAEPLGVVVGMHKARPFPTGYRWLCITEHEDGSWHKQLMPATRPRPQIGDKR